MQKVNKNIKNSDALKGFLFRVYNACRYNNVGQVLPDNKQNLIENNSCVVGPEQQLLRTSALFNCQVKPDLHIGDYKGFTLIELLVVVLIIGILAAVALPQYQRTVEKSRAVEAVSIGKYLKNLEEVYYLEHGQYTDNFETLGAEVSSCKLSQSKKLLTCKYFYFSLLDTYNRVLGIGNIPSHITFSFPLDHNISSHLSACVAYKDDDYRGARLCKNLTGSMNEDGESDCNNTCRVWRWQ